MLLSEKQAFGGSNCYLKKTTESNISERSVDFQSLESFYKKIPIHTQKQLLTPHRIEYFHCIQQQ